MIGLLHSYSRANPGDGLLTDLTMRRLRRIGASADDVLLVALDPGSFPEFPRRVKLGARGRGLGPELVPAAGRATLLTTSALTGRSIGRAARELRKCDAIVAVGGGYLRSVDRVSSAGTLLNHVPQLAFAGRAGVPSLYFPQTVGPLRGPVGKAVLQHIERIDAVCVRDPYSQAELADLASVRRIPDLAVLDIAERWGEIDPVGSTGKVGIAAGQLPQAAGYERHLLEMTERLGAAWVVHKTGHRTKSDTVLFERLGVTPDGGLTQMLRERRLSVMVSVWLHGALMAIASGVPAIHLAYDRKGPGAFGDLGLDRWCFDIRSLDFATLNAAVDELLIDPERYWGSVASQVPRLRAASADLDALVGAMLG